jgi:hypothetical protein
LGDISFGARWEPFPLKAGRLPLILFGNISTKTGDSPYEINPTKDLSTGKGYYSAGIGASTRKYIDPVVLFASVSANYGFKETGLNQRRGTRIIDEFDPGISGGFAFGFAYSFNYDVSLTMSYQQSFNTGVNSPITLVKLINQQIKPVQHSRLPRCTCFTRYHCKWYVGNWFNRRCA